MRDSFPLLRGLLVSALCSALLVSMFLAMGCGDEDPAPIPVILVPDEYPTPQAAMDAAQPGDLITVRPGIYTHTEVRNIDEVNYPGGVRAALFMKDGVAIQGLGDQPGQAILRDTTDSPFTVGAVFDSVGTFTYIDNLAIEEFSVGVLQTGRNGQVQNSRISDCPVGVHAVRAQAPGVVANYIVRSEQVGVLSEDVADGLVWLNIVRDCETGVEIRGTGFVRVPTNLLCRNSVGLRVAEGAMPDAWFNSIHFNRENGVLLESGAHPAVIQNDIFENGIGFEVEVYEKPLSQPVNGTTNFWASVDTMEIRAEILDRIDDPTRGAVVDYIPASPAVHYPLAVDVNTLCAAESPQDDAALLVYLRLASERIRTQNASRRGSFPAQPQDP